MTAWRHAVAHQPGQAAPYEHPSIIDVAGNIRLLLSSGLLSRLTGPDSICGTTFKRMTLRKLRGLGSGVAPCIA